MAVLRSPTLLSDERLALLAGAGSDPAFAMLYRRYDGKLHGYCMSIVRDADDARDALQNAWVKVLVALRAQTRKAPVRPWLFRIVHNEAISVIRRRSGDEPLLEAHGSASVAGADEVAAGRERVGQVVADIRELPDRQREALVLREWADLEYEEIALTLAVTEGNARQLVFQARSGLQQSRAGRELPCDEARMEIATADGRRLRARRIRAHLEACAGCREFAAEARERRRAAAAFLPWSPLAGPGLLQGILAAAGGSAGGTAGGSALAGGLAKAAAVAVLVTGGVGGAELAVQGGGGIAPAPRVLTEAGWADGMPVADASSGNGSPGGMPERDGSGVPAARVASGSIAPVETTETAETAETGPSARDPGREHDGSDRDARRSEERGSARDSHHRHDRGDARRGDDLAQAPEQTSDPRATHTNVLRGSSGAHTDAWSHESRNDSLVEEQR